MKVTRRVFPRVALVLCMAATIGFLGLGVGCSKDEILGDATAQGVEAGLNSLLASTVDPLFAFYGFVADLVGGAPAGSARGGGLTCPDMGTVCAGGGSGTCAVTGGGSSLTFDFTSCVVATDDLPLTLSGGLVAVPGNPIQLTFNGLSVNGSPAMVGTGSVNVVNCAYTSSISTDDPAFISGTVVQCESDDFPTAASVLDITLEGFVIHITFNGTSVANATATEDGSLVANCTINLASNPPTSSCDAP